MKQWGLISVLGITGLLGWGLWTEYFVSESKPVNAYAALSAIDECDAIAEKSVSHLTAVVEFQTLEIAGRRARVFRLCMHDHGFKENPEWAKIALKEVRTLSALQHISENEAGETLRREAMLRRTPNSTSPVYWVSTQKK